MQICVSPSEPSRTDTVHLLMAPYWPNRTWFPELMFLATAPPWKIPLRRDLLFSQREGTLWHPHLDLWSLHVWSLDGKVLGVLLLAVVNTTTSARAPSTRQACDGAHSYRHGSDALPIPVHKD